MSYWKKIKKSAAPSNVDKAIRRGGDSLVKNRKAIQRGDAKAIGGMISGVDATNATIGAPRYTRSPSGMSRAGSPSGLPDNKTSGSSSGSSAQGSSPDDWTKTMPSPAAYAAPTLQTFNAQQIQAADSGVGLKKMGEIAESNPWINLAKEKQQLEQKGMLDTATQQAESQGAQARSNLAMSGGLKSGARERLARSSAWNTMQAQQNIGQQGALARMGIETEGEKMRQDTIGKLTSAEQNRANYLADVDKTNQSANLEQQRLQSAQDLNAAASRNMYNQGDFQTRMQGFGAARTADAIAASGNVDKNPIWDEFGHVKELSQMRKNPSPFKGYG